MYQLKRRPWLDADNKVLISLWERVGSISLISIIMGRSKSSIQTQASRLGLPQRDDFSSNHRHRWSESDDRALEVHLKKFTGSDGKIEIQGLARAMERSVDAIISRLESWYENDPELLSRLVIPDVRMDDDESTGFVDEAKKKRSGSKAGKRYCLRCRKTFWSAGEHNRVCINCKRSDDWDD